MSRVPAVRRAGRSERARVSTKPWRKIEPAEGTCSHGSNDCLAAMKKAEVTWFRNMDQKFKPRIIPICKPDRLCCALDHNPKFSVFGRPISGDIGKCMVRRGFAGGNF